MCKKRSEIGSEIELKSEVLVYQELEHLMDDPIVAPGSAPSSNEDKPRVKFLCSFSGSILPRPHDGKLRYVGGETRIVSLPCDITYNELMAKMREIYDGAMILKYQQPDEDLDALVSVVNDDDVMNMMEEYDKLGAGDGFTRLRIFLFSHADLDGSVHFVDGDERESERRYMEALNSLNESPNYMRSHNNEAQVFSPADDGHVGVEQFFNQMNLEGGGLHNQRNNDLHMPPFHLRQLNIPALMSAQSISQMESPWSAATAAYHSPRQPGVLEPRQVAEYPTSPSSGRYRAQYTEISDKNFDRIHEEYMRNQTNQSLYEHQQQYNDTVSMFPTAVPNERSGFPGNIMGSSTNVFEVNGVCNNCRITFPRNQLYPEPLYQQLTEPQSMGNNGYHHVTTPCAECLPNREMYMLNADTSIHHAYYPAEQIDPRHVYNENQSRERGWTMQHQLTPRAEELRPHNNGDSNNMGISHGQINLPESHHVPLHLVHYDDPRYILSGPEVSNQVFHDTALAAGSNVHVQPMDERGVRYANPAYGIRTDGVFQVGHGHASSPSLWRNVQSPMHGGSSYEPSGPPQLANGLINPGYIRMEGSPKPQTGLENQNPWVESSPKNLGLDSEAHCLTNAYNHDNGLFHKVDAVHCSPVLRSFAAPLDPSLSFAAQLDSSGTPDPVSLVGDKLVLPAFAGAEPVRLVRPSPGEHKGGVREEMVEPSSLDGFICASQKIGSDGVGNPVPVNATLAPVARNSGPTKDISVCVAVECDDEVKSSANINGGGIDAPDADAVEEHQNVPDALDVHGDLELDSDNENSKKSKIELTKAEEEALSRGLQTIRNEDLEEIRELGTGTYGAVYHGKWKGSDVAIKRIKASCFAGRPSERERLISDFWKEALILSSLHHPNVVSFYGVVRDGPDGSLATVTEFMVNGSLKQFLQKKDRTIDRRKRLLIAMDTAFGMEYLHGKSIVHFDLKCENLLVNMRDPHRPVCKIGDLGLSKVKQHTLVSGGVRGTLPWMAPELLSGKSNMVTEKIDVYSFGVVMWELLTGDEPYKDMHCASIIGGIVNNTLRPTIPTWCDPEWKSLMESSWSSDPALRPSFSEISQKLRSMAVAMNLK